MNCQKFESIVGELARSQMMEADIRGDALAHSEECSGCAQRLQSEEALTRRLRALATETSPKHASSRVEQQLLQAFRERKVLQTASASKNHWHYWLSAAAAILLIVASAAAIRWHIERSAMQTPQLAAGVNEKANPLKTPVTGGSPDQHVRAVKHSVGNRKAKRRASDLVAKDRVVEGQKKTDTVAANTVGNEITTEFLPVGYLNAANLQDGGQIVRVELPRSAMVSFGLPVNMDRYNEKVKADVLLGFDGVARAIRFVQ